MRRIGMTMVIAAALLALAPTTAVASPLVTSHVVARTSGVEIAGQVLSRMRGVQLSASGATVTPDVAGHAQPVHVDFGEVTKGLDGAKGPGLFALAMFPVAAGVFFRMVRFLTGLGK